MNKKRIISILLVIVLCIPHTTLKARAEDEEKEFIPIYTIEDLVGINNDPSGNYILMNDIDMTEETATGGSWDTGHGWTPLNEFSGKFDGNGHRINGMHMYGDLSYESAGLFETVTGDIYNLGVTNVNIEGVSVTGEYYVTGIGAIAGILSGGGNISRCYVTGNISAYGSCGGIVGYFPYGYISNCYNAASVTGCGIIGRHNLLDSYALVSYCYNVGKVTREAIGEAEAYKNNYSLYEEHKEEHKDEDDDEDYDSDEKYWTVLTEAQMRTQNMYVGFDFENIWEIDANSTYPYPQLKSNRHQRVDGIEIVSKPNKTVYDQGEDVDTTGGTIKVIYEDGYDTTILMTKNLLEPYDTSETGVQKISVNYGGKVADFSITVKEIPVVGVSISGEGNTLQKGKQMKLNASVEPANATNQNVTWSTNSTGASVDASGNVKALAVGNVVVTATASNGVSAQYNISITAPCVMLMIDQTALTMYKGEQTVLHSILSPIDTTDHVTWSSSNEMIGTVGTDGTVTANSPGDVQITAKADSGVSAVCNITVKQKLDSFYIVGVVDKQYTGKKIKQEIEVTDGINQLKQDQDYEVSYTDNVDAGVAKVTITGKGYYEGSLVKDFNIFGKSKTDGASNASNDIEKVKITKIVNIKKKKIQVKFKDVEGADGYEIRYSTKKNMSSAKTRTTSNNKYILSSMKRKRYYIQVRAYYYGESSQKIYGSWSAKKSVKVKR